MANTHIPSFEEIYERYRALWTVLYMATDTAAPEAAAKFRGGMHTFDGGVHAGDFRLYVRDYLDKHGIESEAEAEFERERVNNCGLSLRFDGATVKVYKSDNGGLPPARTRAQKRHYQQDELWQNSLWSLLRPQGQDGEELELAHPKLVAHWHVAPPPSLRLINLMLALPNGAGNAPFWNEPLPNPVTQLVGVATRLSDEDADLSGLTRRMLIPTGDGPLS